MPAPPVLAAPANAAVADAHAQAQTVDFRDGGHVAAVCGRSQTVLDRVFNHESKTIRGKASLSAVFDTSLDFLA